MLTKTCAYKGSIRGNYRTEYTLDFPFSLMASPPLGWTFRRVTLWRKGQTDQCWRVKFVRRNPRHSPSPHKD